MIRVGIIGGTAYTAGELTRLLINHPDVQMMWIQSNECVDELVSDIHQGLIGECYLRLTDTPRWDEIDVVFCCEHSGKSRDYITGAYIPGNVKIIDMSGDYRIENGSHDFVYGLPELNRKKMVRGAVHVANPGAFATAIQLALLPLAKNLLLNSDIHVTAISGDPLLADNVMIYKPLSHNHVDEIKQSLKSLQNSFNSDIYFIPMLGSFSRGLMATVYLTTSVGLNEIRGLFEDYYSDHNFTFVTDKQVDLKDVANTNKCILHLDKIGDKLLITSVIDSMLKGSAGTAVHNMNLLFGLSERTGLALKPSAL